MFFSALVAFLVYWLLIFVSNYVLVEYGQNYLYDEATPRFGLKVALGSFLLALLAWRLRPGFDTMFTSGIHWTALQAIAWAVVFTVLYQFHPTHGLGIGLASMLIVVGLATMTADSLTRPGRTIAPVRSGGGVPVRRPLTPPTATRTAK